MPDMNGVPTEALLGEVWRRRVEWLWKMCEATAYGPLDIEWLDEQIAKEEEDAARKAR